MLYRHIRLIDRGEIEKRMVEEGFDKDLVKEYISYNFKRLAQSMNATDDIVTGIKNIGYFKFKPLRGLDKAEENKDRIRSLIYLDTIDNANRTWKIKQFQESYEHIIKKVNKYNKRHKTNTQILRKYGIKEYRKYLASYKKYDKEYELPFD